MEPSHPNPMPIEPEFEQALRTLGVELDESIVLRLQQYAQVMWRWNEQLNLTRHTTWDLFVGRDLRDCLQLSALLESGEDVLDLGSGNGIPGIPLSILRSDLNVSLAESRYFPPMTVQLIASGEASGHLEQMLERAAVQQDRETETLIATLLGLFEPLLILTMGLMVLVIVLAILLPIFDLNQLVR